jgi:hypothetical protein
VSLPRWVDARWNTRGRMRLILSCTGVLVVGVTSITRERERVWPWGELSELATSAFLPLCLPLLALLRPPFMQVLDIPFYRYKEMAQLYNGGVAMC